MQASVKVTENGSFNIFNKSQEFRFTPEGLFRRKGRKSGPSKEDEDQLSFKVWHRAACAATSGQTYPPICPVCRVVHVGQDASS